MHIPLSGIKLKYVTVFYVIMAKSLMFICSFNVLSLNQFGSLYGKNPRILKFVPLCQMSLHGISRMLRNRAGFKSWILKSVLAARV